MTTNNATHNAHTNDNNPVVVSVIIPCLNEARFIEGVIENLLNQDFPQDNMEIFLIDGGSSDETQSLIERRIVNHPNFYLLENTERYVPQAMNKGIKFAKGEIIIRMDAHAAYPSDYISKLVYWQNKLDAENVGGLCLMKPRNSGLKARAIARVLTHIFGVGNATYRIGADRPIEVDTVPFGCFKQTVFDTYGEYDSRLHRNQDIELNKRIVRQGGKVFLIPDVQCTYFARDTYASLSKNNYQNGKWVVLTAKKTGNFSSLSVRHFVPLTFVLYLIGLIALILVSTVGSKTGLYTWIASTPLLIYLLVIGCAAVSICIRESESRLFFYVIAAFVVLHISYGAGSIIGMLSAYRIFNPDHLNVENGPPA